MWQHVVLVVTMTYLAIGFMIQGITHRWHTFLTWPVVFVRFLMWLGRDIEP